MSLVFGGAASDRASIAAATSINTLPARTILMWVYVTTLTSARTIWSKDVANTFILSGTGGDVRLQLDQATTDTNYITSNAPLALNTWTCLAYTYDQAATPRIHIYAGTLSALMAEATYGTATDGSGNAADDSAGAWLWGNRSAFDRALQGRIAVGMAWNRVLALGELKAQQFRPHVTSGCVIFNIFGFNGTGTQPDWSGNLNAGTVTGATVGPHAPLRPAFGFSGGWLGNFTASGGTLFTLDVSGSITPASALIRQANTVYSGSIVPVSTLSRQVAKALSGSLDSIGLIIKQVNTAYSGQLTPPGGISSQVQTRLAGSITPSGILANVRVAVLALAGAITPAGNLIRQVNKLLSGLLTPVGNLIKQVNTSYAGQLTPPGGIASQVQTRLSGSVTPGGTLANIKVAILSVAGSIVPTGALVFQVNKILSGIITPTSNLIKQVSTAYSGQMTPVGGIVKNVSTFLNGAIGPVGTLTNVFIPAGAVTAPLVALFKGMYKGMFKRIR